MQNNSLPVDTNATATNALVARGHGKALLIVGLLMVLVLSGCGRSRPEPTATPTKTAAAGQGQGAGVAAATPTPQPAPVDNSAADDNAANSSTASSGDTASNGSVAANSDGSPVAVVDADLLNVRAEPRLDATILREVRKGDTFDIIERSANSEWVMLSTGGQSVGWTAAEFLTITGNLNGVTASSAASAQADSGSQETDSQDTQAASPAEPAPAEPAPAEPAPVEPAPAQPAASTTFASSSMNSPDFGAQAFLWWRSEVADRDLKLMQEGGFNWVKQAFAWETIEAPNKGQFDWSIADRVVKQVNGRNLKLLARLSSDPELGDFWAGHPPGNAANFADYAFALASRYNCSPGAVGCIQAYQIWNEPNLAREWGNNPPNPAQYADFLRQAYAAIKRGNPNAIVINAGMAPTGTNNAEAMPDDVYYTQMYQAMGGNSNGYFDMLGVHGAGFAAPPELDPADAIDPQYGGYRFFSFRHVEDIRRIMESNGDSGKKIVLLEFGWTYDSVNGAYKWHGADAGIDASIQGEYLRNAYKWAAANWQPWIGLMSMLTMPNLDWLNDGNPRDEEQYWWAIMEPSDVDSLTFRPAFIKLCNYFNEQRGQTCIHAPR